MGNLQGFQVTPAQSIDPLQTLAQMGQLRNQQIQRQQAGLQLEQGRMELASNKAMMDAFARGNGDWDATEKLLDASPNILPSARMALEQHRLQIRKDIVGLTEQEFNLAQKNRDRYAGLLEGAYSQDLINKANQDFIQGGGSFADPNDPQSRGVTPLTTFTDKNHVDAFRNGLLLESQQKELALKEAQAGEASGKQIESLATAEEKQIQTQLAQHKINLYNTLMQNPQSLQNRVAASVNPGKDPQLDQLTAVAVNEARNQADIDKINETVQKWAETSANIRKEKDPVLRQNKINDAIKQHVGEQAGEAELITPGLGGSAPAAPAAQAAPGLTGPEPIIHPGPMQTPGEAYLATLPTTTADQIRAIADGRMTIDSIGRNPVARGRLQQALMRYDPTWSEQRAQLRDQFTKDNGIGYLNTAVVHGDQFMQAAEAMKNFSFKPGNAVYNWFSQTFGAAPPTNLEAIKNAWAGEMASALKGGPATDQEIKNVEAGMTHIASLDQFKGLVNENLKALGAKMNTFYQRGQQNGLGNWTPMLPAAKQVFQKYGMDPLAAPQTRNAPAAGLQYLRTANGPKGHKIGQTADGKWHDMQTGAVIQ